MENKNGISLVALIITIIVMAILAGVVIVTAVMDGGIIERSQGAQTEYEIGQELETLKLAVASAYQAGGTIIEENLVKALDSEIGEEKYSLDSSNNEYFEVTILETKRTYRIYPNGKVEGPITGNVLGKATVGIRVEINSTIDGKAYSSTNPLIPAGFTAINMDNAKWDATEGPEVDNGLVIRDDSGNEFVWVPVENEISTSTYSYNGYTEPAALKGQTGGAAGIAMRLDGAIENLETAGCKDKNSDGTLNMEDFNLQLQEEYEEMAKRVNKYEGFYVGRYETSKNGTNIQSKRSQTASGSGQTVQAETGSWYELYALNKKYSTNSVSSSIMWGVHFNAIMNWTNAMSLNIFVNNINTTLNCGTNSNDVKNNIYDLYGGAAEWTMLGKDYDGRIFFGYTATGPSTYKLVIDSPFDSYSRTSNKGTGARLVLTVN